MGLALALSAAACGGCRSSFEAAVAQLHSLDPEARRDAADDLRDAGPIPAAVPLLLSAARWETDHDAYGAMMIALGASGDAQARPFIEPCLSAADDYLRKWAERALQLWLVGNGVLEPREDLPDIARPYFDWPEHLSLSAASPGARPITDTTGAAAARQEVSRRFCAPR